MAQSCLFYRRAAVVSTSRQYEGSGELIVVGAFDTTYRNSQVTYCSVGEWNGQQLSKVGEGLCNSALSKGMKITTSALAGPYDVYVAGSFQTQVWNGDRHEFVKIFNIAHFNALEQVWLPLKVGQITCSWCTVTVLALAWDSKRRQLHVAGKFNAIDGRNVPAGLAIYDVDSGHLVAHPGGGLTMRNQTQDGVGTALQLDEERGVLYVMGSFERLTATGHICMGLAAYEIKTNRWTCLADAAHTVLPTGGGNMLLTQHGLMVAGETASSTTWPDASRPYTIALLKATLKTEKTRTKKKTGDDDSYVIEEEHTQYHDFNWSWLPGFYGHDEPLHALSNGFADYEGTVFIAGDNLVAKWSYELAKGAESDSHSSSSSSSSSQPQYVPVTEVLSIGHIRGSIMAISQMMPEPLSDDTKSGKNTTNVTIIAYGIAVGCVIGMFGAIMCNRNRVFPFLGKNSHLKGISLDTLTYSALENSNITDAYQRAMKVRYVQHPHLLTIIDPQEIFLQRIIGEGTFGRVWSARWSTASVAVKEFVFAQAAVAGKSSMQQEIVEEIIGEAGMMAILRHPNVLQLFGCSLTAQAIWIVSELCSLGSLRQVLDDNDRVLPVDMRLSLALQVAEGMAYLHNQDPPIIHRDLKSHNIFVHETFTDVPAPEPSRKGAKGWRKKLTTTSDDAQPEKMKTNFTLVAKIGDWGSARATLSGSRTMTHGVGTACWLAPEVIKHARSSKYSDVYGYGIVLWELATREEVYQGLETTQIIAKVANESLRPPIPQDCPWKDLMVKCWEENPQDRLEFTEIVQQLGAVTRDLVDSQNRDDSEIPDGDENATRKEEKV
jgi:Protein tyrosine and serine/threonine kinase